MPEDEDIMLWLSQRSTSQYHESWKQDIRLQKKYTGSEGLQIADLVARPVGLSIVRPSQSNRAFQILKEKFHKDDQEEMSEYGFHIYPLKSEKPQGCP